MEFKLIWHTGDESLETCNVEDVTSMCPIADEAAVLALEIGESHTDSDGDTWERIA